MADINPAPGYTVMKRISWSAVFAGTAVALVVYFLLNLLGVGIGLGVVSFTGPSSQAQGVGIGAAIWMFLSTIIALFVGGWASGRFAGAPSRTIGLTHGLVTFSLFTIVSLYVLTTGIGSIVSGAGNMIGQALQAMGPNAAQSLGAGEATQNIDPQQATAAAEDVRRAVSTGSIYVFIALVLGGIAAIVGGLAGAPRRTAAGNIDTNPI